MNYRVVIDDADIGHWVAERANCGYNPKRDVTAGVIDDSKPILSPGYIRGGVIFTNYTQSAMWVHVAGINEYWITRDMLWFTFDYAFRQAGCGWLYGVVEVANQHTLNFDLKLGFRVIATLEGLFPSGNGVIVGMRRDECRWLGVRPRNLRANV